MFLNRLYWYPLKFYKYFSLLFKFRELILRHKLGLLVDIPREIYFLNKFYVNISNYPII